MLFNFEGKQKFCHGTVQEFDEARRVYPVSYDDGDQHDEMLDYGHPEICRWKRRTAEQDAAATLRAQQQRIV
jgi:hypothetical protein